MKKLFFTCLAVSALVGCPQPPPPPPVATPIPTPQIFRHTVSFQGENLGKIAKWYTGSVNNWKAIAEANPGLNPKKLVKGVEVVVPYDLVTNFEPMPKKFVTPPVPRSSRRKVESFVVDESETSIATPSSGAVPPTVAPISTPLSTTGERETPTMVPPPQTAIPSVSTPIQPTVSIEHVTPTLASEPVATQQPASKPQAPDSVGDNNGATAKEGEKSMEDLVAEEKRVLEQLQKEFQGDNSLAPH